MEAQAQSLGRDGGEGMNERMGKKGSWREGGVSGRGGGGGGGH